ncbi:probable ADP-ribosylglycohydrolase [Plesiocystis pacifica SIR-1]|uniref:Probable ADP-ribosylglycohydrolase n=1 Tax=Plesiocystis pacifica SIR-1 TaxID=391625 RepID=A6GEA7_9BACT|nr:ADP-ribosylglycohydrolase family protein [Plesiocystis pacifica]EDM75825.1 probable ADP-ribosylglycohydrolase [Plesiocystis pacifica SIR-1]
MLSEDAAWDRVAGCMHGLLIGDALGCPVEGWTPMAIERRFGTLINYEHVPGPHWRPRGLHSDDGQQALAVADAIALDPKAPEREFAKLLVALREAGPQQVGRWGLHRGVGSNLRQTVRGLMAATKDDPLAFGVRSGGNGAAMRIAPVGLWWRDAPSKRDHFAARISAVTHSDLRGIGAAQAVAIAVSEAFWEPPLPILRPEFVGAVERARCRARDTLELPDDRRFGDLLGALVEHRARCDDLNELLDGIAERANATGGAHGTVKATNGFAPCSVLTALTVADLVPEFERAVITAVNLGGDADTIGAMVGAIQGARRGLGQIPERWLDGLHATGSIFERIEALFWREPGPAHPPLVVLEGNLDRLFEDRPRTIGRGLSELSRTRGLGSS